VKAGYARNYLIPQGKAKRATPENLKLLESRRSELEKAAAEKLATAEAPGAKLEGMTLKIVQKAGVDGRLFGSVGNIDVAKALAEEGISVDKSQLRLASGPLKQVGDHPVSVVLHTDVVANIVVQVQGDLVQN